MSDNRRLIEVAFPLEQASIDSVHEKTVRHGHISTLHLWPARRPLAASRAALVATLLPDPGTPEKRQEVVERLGGRVVKVLKRKQGPGGGEDKVVKETVGGILHWGREIENQAELERFREEIRHAYGGRAPRVLDPFAGGGAIPLEAMRLGCEVTAVDINPVAWFILKCTLEYPQKLVGQRRPLPEFIRTDREFMEAFFKAQGIKGAMLRTQLRKLGLDPQQNTGGTQPSLDLEIEAHTLDAELSWHVRAWGFWVLREARRELAQHYPVYADWEPVKHVADWRARHPDRARPMQLVPLREDGTADIDSLNAHLSTEDLSDDNTPRWVSKPTVAYLWARTVQCKGCRAVLPLLKTLWIARTPSQRVLLEVNADKAAKTYTFGIKEQVPKAGGNNAQRRENDRRLGAATMSRSGATCPFCGVINTMDDIQAEGKAGRLDRVLTAVAMDGRLGKEFRLPTRLELTMARPAAQVVDAAFADVPFGPPDDLIVEDAKKNTWCVQYGIDRFSRLFTERQLLALATFVKGASRTASRLRETGYPEDWAVAVHAYVAASVSRLTDFLNCGAQWKLDRATINHFFVRYAMPLSWDFAEGNVLSEFPGGYDICLRKIAAGLDVVTQWRIGSPAPKVICASSVSRLTTDTYDVVLTDPPYYNAIGYAVVMDFFYVWLRRMLYGVSPEYQRVFSAPLTPKWDSNTQDGELVDDASRHGDDSARSKLAYEQGMERVFGHCRQRLTEVGRLVVVFAHKDPDAWDALVSATIRSGFVVDGSWPIRTEQATRMRALSSAALASSVWLACRPRQRGARPGWDNVVLEEMRRNIGSQLREFWDAGIHGPDFVWAATGPALEAYSKHPVVKKANAPGETMSVGEFLKAVRRIVVEFVVGRVLGEAAHVDSEQGTAAAAGLDDVTTYYLLHRHDFGMNDAPAGACILYAVSCNLSERELADRYDLLIRTGGVGASDDDEAEDGDADGDEDAEEGSGSTFKLKPWKQRRRPTLGFDPIAEQARRSRMESEARGPRLFEEMGPDAAGAARARVIPLIDSVHRLMHLWVDGDVAKVNEYLDDRGLRRSEAFRQVLQALIELAGAGSEERSVLESLSNHVRVLGERADSLFDRTRG